MPQPNNGPEVPQFAAAAALAKMDDGFTATKGPTGKTPELKEPLKESLKPKAPPPNLYGGTMKKLDVYGKPGSDPNEPIEGYVLYWFDDIQGGQFIQQALRSGWEFVTRDEVEVNAIEFGGGNVSLDEKVRVRSGNDGISATYFILMKKDKELDDYHRYGPESVEVKVHQQQEIQLSQGSFGSADGRYTAMNPPPGARSGLPTIKIGRYYKPPTT